MINLVNAMKTSIITPPL